MSCDCTGMLIAEMCIRSRGALRCRVYYRSGNNISPLSVRTSVLSLYFHMSFVLCMHTWYYISVRMRMKQHVLSRTSSFRSKRCIRYVIYFPVSTQFNLSADFFRVGGVWKASVSAFDLMFLLSRPRLSSSLVGILVLCLIPGTYFLIFVFIFRLFV